MGCGWNTTTVPNYAYVVLSYACNATGCAPIAPAAFYHCPQPTHIRSTERSD